MNEYYTHLFCSLFHCLHGFFSSFLFFQFYLLFKMLSSFFQIAFASKTKLIIGNSGALKSLPFWLNYFAKKFIVMILKCNGYVVCVMVKKKTNRLSVNFFFEMNKNKEVSGSCILVMDLNKGGLRNLMDFFLLCFNKIIKSNFSYFREFKLCLISEMKIKISNIKNGLKISILFINLNNTPNI